MILSWVTMLPTIKGVDNIRISLAYINHSVLFHLRLFIIWHLQQWTVNKIWCKLIYVCDELNYAFRFAICIWCFGLLQVETWLGLGLNIQEMGEEKVGLSLISNCGLNFSSWAYFCGEYKGGYACCSLAPSWNFGNHSLTSLFGFWLFNFLVQHYRAWPTPFPPLLTQKILPLYQYVLKSNFLLFSSQFSCPLLPVDLETWVNDRRVET